MAREESNGHVTNMATSPICHVTPKDQTRDQQYAYSLISPQQLEMLFSNNR